MYSSFDELSSSFLSLLLALAFCFMSAFDSMLPPGWSDGTDPFGVYPSYDFPIDEDAYEAAQLNVNSLRRKCFYGTNQQLRGKVTAVVIYMDDFESDWTNAQIDEFTEKDVKPALEFLEKEAAKYGVELSFDIKILRNAYYDAEIITDIISSGLTTIDALEQAAKCYDYDSQYDIHDRLAEKYGTEVVFITVFNKPGCGYGLNPKPWTDFKAVEHSIMFSIDKDYQTEYEPGTNAPVIVSTMLHLFGGESLNKPEGRKYISQILYPYDIMRTQPFDITESEIGEATAYYIGWIDEVPEAVYSMGWNDYEE